MNYLVICGAVKYLRKARITSGINVASHDRRWLSRWGSKKWNGGNAMHVTVEKNHSSSRYRFISCNAHVPCSHDWLSLALAIK